MTRVWSTQAAFKEGDLDNNGALSAEEISFALKKLKVGMRVQGLGFSLVWRSYENGALSAEELSFAVKNLKIGIYTLNSNTVWGFRV